MSLKMFNILLLMCVIMGSVVAAHDVLVCCSPGANVVHQAEEDTYVCLEEKTNTTTPVPLGCKQMAKFNEDSLNFTINDLGQLDWGDNEIYEGLFCRTNKTKTNKDGLTTTIRQIVLCIDEEMYDDEVLGYCLIVSGIFLTLTALVYIFLPELRDLQGKSIIHFCISLGIGVGILAMMKLMSYTDIKLCAVRGFLTYFFLIATFFWTNALSIQILLSLKRPVVNNYGWKEFSWYALYAWGCATILTVCLVIANYHPGDHIKPGIGFEHCWFLDHRRQWYYMYSVMTILIIINICIFIYTSTYLWKMSFSSSHSKALRYKFILTMRMFIIMGVPWIFEMLGSVTGQTIVTYILDIFNTLQGPLIFLVLVVFRKRVIKALLKRGVLDCVAGPIEKYLALGDDDEEGVVQHTLDVTMDERNGI